VPPVERVEDQVLEVERHAEGLMSPAARRENIAEIISAAKSGLPNSLRTEMASCRSPTWRNDLVCRSPWLHVDRKGADSHSWGMREGRLLHRRLRKDGMGIFDPALRAVLTAAEYAGHQRERQAQWNRDDQSKNHA
jgi:hypothetical protein